MKPIKKKFLASGLIIDAGKMEIPEIVKNVQSQINSIIGENRVFFNIVFVEESKSIELKYQRILNYEHPIPYDKILDGDAHIICGNSKTWSIPYIWQGVPFYAYKLPVSEFIDCYKKSAVKLGANRPKEIRVIRFENEIVLKLNY